MIHRPVVGRTLPPGNGFEMTVLPLLLRIGKLRRAVRGKLHDALARFPRSSPRLSRVQTLNVARVGRIEAPLYNDKGRTLSADVVDGGISVIIPIGLEGARSGGPSSWHGSDDATAKQIAPKMAYGSAPTEQRLHGLMRLRPSRSMKEFPFI